MFKQFLLCMVLLVMPAACSTLDSGDRNDLRTKIAALPPSDLLGLRKLAAIQRAEEMLRKLKGNQKIGGLWCRQGQGTYLPEVDVTASDMISCLIGLMIYKECTTHIELAAKVQAANSFNSANITDFDCHFTWLDGWDPKLMPAETDPDRIGIDDVIDAMIALPAPPPGLVWTSGQLSELLPMLCPLGAEWGCPGSPYYPGGSGRSP